MKIYQLHKYGGEWGDAYDDIIGSYLHEARAEEAKTKAEAQEIELREQSRKCEDCPFLYDEYITNDELLSYCPKAALTKSEYSGVICENYCVDWWENHFRIEEVEVIE